jgi:hypothetical protein
MSEGPKKIKNRKEKLYYQKELEREKVLMQEIEDKIKTKELIPPDGRLFSQLSLEEKNKTVIGFMADKIQWGQKNLLIYEDKTVADVISELLKAIAENPRILQILMTFLPLDLFNDDDSINIPAFTSFLEIEGNRLKTNIQQYRLGLGEDLYEKGLYHFLSKFHELWSTYGLPFDFDNMCAKYVDYNIYLNLFILYMFSRSNNKIFPVSFRLTSNTNYNLFIIRYILDK